MSTQTVNKIATRGQKLAQAARKCISQRGANPEYLTFAKRFPSLIHACGLAQALAFAESKAKNNKALRDYLLDLTEVSGESKLMERSRESELMVYMNLTRRSLESASWIKRYAEASMAADE